MDSVSPINHFGTPTQGDYTVTVSTVQGSDTRRITILEGVSQSPGIAEPPEYAFCVTRTAPGRVRGIKLQQLVEQSVGYPDRDSAIEAGIKYVDSLFDPHNTSKRMAYTDETIRSICIARDMDWDAMTKQERESFIDTLLHEDKNPPKADIESDPVDVEKENAGDM